MDDAVTPVGVDDPPPPHPAAKSKANNNESLNRTIKIPFRATKALHASLLVGSYVRAV
jgi:hypothetical protein